MVALITDNFKELSQKQVDQFKALQPLYTEWNAKINLISRKDIEALYLKHILHSLAIAKFIQFESGTRVLDIGTGGGFPGIPLAIMFPEVKFTLVDSIAKKIKVAEDIAQQLKLTNTEFAIGRVEHIGESFDFITARAVAPVSELYQWTHQYLGSNHNNSKLNGYLLLKGGDLTSEIAEFKKAHKKWQVEEITLNQWFNNEFFDTKKLLYIYR